MSPSAGLRRRALYPGPVVDGRAADTVGGRWRRRVDRLLVSAGEREEAELERLIGSHPSVTRANVVGVISPKGGVGKTTSAFVVGSLIADRLRLRVVAVDANPDFGTLASLAPDKAALRAHPRGPAGRHRAGRTPPPSCASTCRRFRPGYTCLARRATRARWSSLAPSPTGSCSRCCPPSTSW